MEIPREWILPKSIQEAKEAQRVMASRLILEDRLGEWQSIGGVDVSNNLYDPKQMVYAACVVLSVPSLQVMEQASVSQKQTFPYIPGLLGFREAPALVKAFRKLKKKPDLLIVDGHGISHPRGLGIASHLGLLLDIPTIGVAKSILFGSPAGSLGSDVGAEVALVEGRQLLAMLLRTKARSHPLIISPGHKISLKTAVKIVKSCLKGYRLPEATRQAHLAANATRKSVLIH